MQDLRRAIRPMPSITPSTVDWIRTRDRRNLPPYGEKVPIIRPNQKTGKMDLLVGRLERAKEEGVFYGKLGDERLTYDDYWIVQGVGVLRFDRVTHWAAIELPHF